MNNNLWGGWSRPVACWDTGTAAAWRDSHIHSSLRPIRTLRYCCNSQGAETLRNTRIHVRRHLCVTHETPAENHSQARFVWSCHGILYITILQKLPKNTEYLQPISCQNIRFTVKYLLVNSRKYINKSEWQPFRCFSSALVVCLFHSRAVRFG